MNQNYHIGDYLNLDGDVHPYRVIEVSNPTLGYGNTHVMIENGCDEGLSPIKITPETLEAFGFVKEEFIDDGSDVWYKLIYYGYEVYWYVDVIPSPRGWYVSINGENNVCARVNNIHEIQNAMRVVGIEMELRYKG